MLPPENVIVQNIYGLMINHKFNEKNYDKLTNENISLLCSATIDIWKTVKEKFIPTPQKFTYNFTMKDISKIMLGCFRIDKEEIKNSLKNVGLNPKDVIV